MAIKKRSERPVGDTDEAPTKLIIEAKPKTPMPAGGVASTMYEKATPQQLRRIGNVAIDCNELADTGFTIEDRVTCIRTPFDPSNAQEVRYRNRVRNRGTAITAMCIVCQGGRKAVTECIDTKCPLWAFRFGSDPFFGKRVKKNG